MNILNLDNLSYQFADAKKPTFKRVSLTFRAGQMTLIYSASGSGKSTLLKTIAGFYPQYSNGTVNGNINFNQQNLQTWDEFRRRKLIAMMFQNPAQQFCMKNVYDEFIFTLENLQLSNDEIHQRMQTAINICQIQPLIHRQFSTLSGGEKQRVALCIIMAIDAPIILLDEPFASVDPASRIILMQQLNQLKAAGKIIVGIDHDLSGYQSLCDQLVGFDDKQQTFTPFPPDQQPEILARNNHPVRISCKLPLSTSYILEMEHLIINNGNQCLINQAQLGIVQGATTLISGKNGSGKSTFFKALTKQIKYQGQITLDHQDINQIRPKNYFQQIGLVFQDTDKQFLKITVQEDIDLSKRNAIHQWLTTEQINTFIEELGLQPLLDRVIYSLSEGQKQRLQILVMAIMGHPILLMDEPFNGINLAYIKQISKLLMFTKQHGQTQLIISHQTHGLDSLIDYHLHLSEQQFSYQEVF